MNPRLSTITLSLLVIASAGLAGFWVQAHGIQNALQLNLASTQAELDKSSRQSVEEKNLLASCSVEITEQQKSLESAPGSLEIMRWTATMSVINQLKLAHEKNPPARRLKPPPSGPSGSIFFPELLADPEYNRLYALQNLQTTKRLEGPKVGRLGLSPEVSEKIIAVLAEDSMTRADLQSIIGRPGIPGNLDRQQNTDTEHQLQELMGPEGYAQWQKLNEVASVSVAASSTGAHVYMQQPSHDAFVVDANRMLIPKLALRLSYTDAPLQKEQAGQLAEILANYSASVKSRPFKTMTSDGFIQQAAQVLPPTQLQALKELQAEQQASVARGKLPKSSELPRNTQYVR